MRLNLMKRRKQPTRSQISALLPLMRKSGRKRKVGRPRKNSSRKGIAFLPALMMGLGGLGLFSKLGNSLINRKSGRRKMRFDIRKGMRRRLRKGDLDASFLGEFGGLDDDVITQPTQSLARQALNRLKNVFKSKQTQNILKNVGKTAGQALAKKIQNQITQTKTSPAVNKQIADAVIESAVAPKYTLKTRYSGRKNGRKGVRRIY